MECYEKKDVIMRGKSRYITSKNLFIEKKDILWQKWTFQEKVSHILKRVEMVHEKRQTFEDYVIIL